MTEHTPDDGWILKGTLVYKLHHHERNGYRKGQPVLSNHLYFDVQGPHREGVTVGEREDAARRIVTCWNACEGIPTAALGAGAVQQLVEALESLLAHPNIADPDWDDSDEEDKARERKARAVLNLIKGSEDAPEL